MPTVLLYHAIAHLPEATPAGQRSLFVDPGMFAWQLSALAQRGYRTITLDEFHRARCECKSQPRRVMLSFDDAYAHIFDAVTPLLLRHGFTAVVFAPWHHLGSHNQWDPNTPRLTELAIATRHQLRAAARGPWEVASHGSAHVDLRQLDQAVRRAQLAEARLRLSECVGRAVTDLAYPYGLHDADVRDDARAAGYRMAFTAGLGDGEEDLYAVPRRAVRGQEGRKAFLIKSSDHFAELFG